MFSDVKKELFSTPFLTDKEEILKELSILMKNAVKVDEKHILGLSGGVDSSLLAELLPLSVKVIVGIPEASDMLSASLLAKEKGWNVKKVIPTEEEAENVIRKVVLILSQNNVDTDPINVGVGCVVYVLCQQAKEQGIKILVGGLGAEEIFGGYKSHVVQGSEDVEAFQEFCWQRLANIETRDLARDQAIAKEFDIEIKTPFLDRDLATFAMQIHPSLKVKDDERKVILRELALQLGVPQEFALRKKVAAQYGSGFDKVLTKMGKRLGVKSKNQAIKKIKTL